jgi:hypothetical protein
MMPKLSKTFIKHSFSLAGIFSEHYDAQCNEVWSQNSACRTVSSEEDDLMEVVSDGELIDCLR